MAGEKMPWLTVHMALPIALLAGRTMNELYSRVSLPREIRLPEALRMAVPSVNSRLVLALGPVAAVQAQLAPDHIPHERKMVTSPATKIRTPKPATSPWNALIGPPNVPMRVPTPRTAPPDSNIRSPNKASRTAMIVTPTGRDLLPPASAMTGADAEVLGCCAPWGFACKL
jgi:hypothetical protein